MFKIWKKNYCLIFFFIFFLINFFYSTNFFNFQFLSAQEPGYLDRLERVGESSYGVSTPETPQFVVVSIIQIILGLLGLFFLIQLIVAGYQWLMAGGNEEKINHAKDRIKSALIGVVIVFVSYTIVVFVINQLVDITYWGF